MAAILLKDCTIEQLKQQREETVISFADNKPDDDRWWLMEIMRLRVGRLKYIDSLLKQKQ